jgi:hypothetical protein
VIFKVLDFYRKAESINPFIPTLEDPTFCILINRDGKSRELVLNMRGKYSYIADPDMDCFEEEAYKNFHIIVEFLTGDNKELLRERWGLTSKEYKYVIFELYKILVNNHSYFGWLKKKLLILLGYIKFNSGKVEVC